MNRRKRIRRRTVDSENRSEDQKTKKINMRKYSGQTGADTLVCFPVMDFWENATFYSWQDSLYTEMHFERGEYGNGTVYGIVRDGL